MANRCFINLFYFYEAYVVYLGTLGKSNVLFILQCENKKAKSYLLDI